ncbi:MAG: SH3 domain-containing protein, partial [Anaerolinea sp.]|nr:SH3 domain-containing protein [Anaerolinea sp.]
ANGQTYELSITYSGRPTSEAFNLCFRAASGACEGTALAAQTGQNNSPACTVTPLQAGGANIRQSASTNAPIVTVLSGGQSASVIGLSPDNAWLNVTLGAITGWMARSAVVESGACAGVPVVQPPSFQPIAPPTQPPATPQPQPPQPPQPQPPAPTPIPTMSGPCTLTVTAPTFIYTQPIANVSYLGDQAQPAYQYFPNGRLADNSWWRLTTYNWWIETSTFGASVQVTGDCSGLPVVSP